MSLGYALVRELIRSLFFNRTQVAAYHQTFKLEFMHQSSRLGREVLAQTLIMES